MNVWVLRITNSYVSAVKINGVELRSFISEPTSVEVTLDGTYGQD